MDQAKITPELLQQHPLALILTLLFACWFFLLAGGSLVSWIMVIVRSIQGHPILSVAAWTPRVWGLLDIVLLLILAVLWQFMAFAASTAFLGIDMQAIRDGAPMPLEVAALVSLGYVLIVGIVTIWLVMRYSTTLAHVGVSLAKWPVYLFTGVLGGLLILPVIYLGNMLVVLFLDTPYDHPLFTAMAEEGSLGNFLLACFAAVVAAPIAEEFLFRGMLQGWMQSIQFSSPIAILLGASETERLAEARGGVALPSAIVSTELDDQNREATQVLAAEQSADEESANPYAHSASISAEPVPTAKVIPPYWPSIVVGILFGLAHVEYGLSAIPLSILGIALGLLYRATQSIWPGVVVHFLLNFTSMGGLGLNVYIQHVTNAP